MSDPAKGEPLTLYGQESEEIRAQIALRPGGWAVMTCSTDGDRTVHKKRFSKRIKAIAFVSLHVGELLTSKKPTPKKRKKKSNTRRKKTMNSQFNLNTLALLAAEDVTAVGVNYPGSKKDYTFMVHGPAPEIGTKVLVPSGHTDNDPFGVDDDDQEFITERRDFTLVTVSKHVDKMTLDTSDDMKFSFVLGSTDYKNYRSSLASLAQLERDLRTRQSTNARAQILAVLGMKTDETLSLTAGTTTDVDPIEPPTDSTPI